MKMNTYFTIRFFFKVIFFETCRKSTAFLGCHSGDFIPLIYDQKSTFGQAFPKKGHNFENEARLLVSQLSVNSKTPNL
ncbi:hypothetical protein [Algoriphagus ornithinivorans]|uniref:hypothetical protein n=1 Tax=Algoriphagus ornithinivorans TaxID=226506 RepID=UPI000B8A390D|nr:hypothetical protein [Algoriphagus ornithinivorans]